MSRLANKPVTFDKNVSLTIDKSLLMTVSSSGKVLTHQIHGSLEPCLEADNISFKLRKGCDSDKSQLGTIYSITRNMITGVTAGFEKKLKLVGVGYRAALEGTTLVMQLGYSHPVRMDVPSDLKLSIEKQTTIIVSGICKIKVGWFASQIRDKRRPEPYKGKGVRYIDEEILLKEGKKK